MSDIKERAVYEIKLKDDQFHRGLSNAEVKMDSFESSLKGVGATIAAVFAADRLISFGNEAIKVAAKTESLNNAIRFASGADGAKNLEYLDTLARNLGLNLMATTEGFKTFSGALIGSKFEGQVMRDIFTKISYGITTMGLSSEDAKGAMIALGQMVSKGTVSAEELRGQLGERLPGAFQIAARAMGVTTKELGDMLKKGEVVTDVFLPKFADEMEKTFKGGVEAASNSMQANMNRIENRLHSFTNAVGRSFIPIIRALGSETKSATDQFELQKSLLDGLTESVKPLMDRYNTLKNKVSLTKDEHNELSTIMHKIGLLMPTAVTAWDSYGKAIGLSNVKLEDYLRLSKEALAVKNADAIKETTKSLKESETLALRWENSLKRHMDPNTKFAGIWKSEPLFQKPEVQKSYAETLSYVRGSLELARMKADEQREYLAWLKGEKKEQKEEPKVVATLTPEETLNKLFEGFSEEATNKAKSSVHSIFAGLSEKGKNNKISELFTALSGKSPEERIAAFAALGKHSKTKGGKGSSDVGVEKIQAGTRNVTVNIQTIKLAENIVSHKADLSDARVQEMLQRAILTAINDVNIVAQ